MEKRLNGKRISKASLNGFVNYGIEIGRASCRERVFEGV